MRPIIYAVALCLVIGAAVFAFYLFAVRAPADAADNARAVAGHIIDDIARRIQYKPSVTISQKTEFFRNKEVMELALVESSIHQENTWKHEWLGSVKEITLDGSYRVKTGFILDPRFLVDVDPSHKIVTVWLPPPVVLSVEQTGLDLRENDGWWNKLTPADRQTALDDFRQAARLQAEKDSHTLEETHSALVRKLDGFLPGQEWTVRFLPSLDHASGNSPAESP